MRYLLHLVIVLTFVFSMSGCAKKVTAPVPGQLSTYDAYAYRILLDTQAGINAFKGDIASGKVTETPAIRTYLNAAITDYNIAEAAYQAWRGAGGTGSTAPVTAAIAKVQGDFSSAVSTVSALPKGVSQ